MLPGREGTAWDGDLGPLLETGGERTAPPGAHEAPEPERGHGFARFAVLIGVIGLVVLAGLIVFNRSGGYEVTAVFQNGGGLVKGNQVRIGGRPVGTISSIDLNNRSQAVVKMRLNKDAEPLHSGTVATVRVQGLASIAGRYITLAPGPNSAPKIADGGTISSDRTEAPVDLDQLFNSFDAKTREGLRQVIQGSAANYDGKSKQANLSAKYFSPALSTTTGLTREIALDQQVFRRFVRDTGAAMGAIAERRSDLTSLVSNANTASGAIGDENVNLARTLDLLPTTLRRGNTTFVNLRSTLDDLQRFVDVAKPNTRQLALFFRRLRPLVRDSRPTLSGLRRLIRQPGPDNDFTDITAGLPRLAQLTGKVYPSTIHTFNRSQRVIDYARAYTPDLGGWFSHFGLGAAGYDADGHYFRAQPVFSAFKFRDLPGQPDQLDPLPSNVSRLQGFKTGGVNRCPGTATALPPDGSVPYRGTDGKLQCDPSSVIPAP